MKFTTPATTNPIDRLKVVGQPNVRIDGPLKTTGTAPYAYEQREPSAGAAYGYVVGAAIAKGRIVALDVARARAAPGVLAVITAQDAGQLDVGGFYVARALAGPDIQHYHQAVALVVAETFEQARAAAQLVQPRYAATAGAFDLAAEREKIPASAPVPPARASAVGDFAGAFANAEVTVDQMYTTPHHAHAMLEPHATIAAWDGDKLTLWTAIQLVGWGLRDIAKILGIPQQNVRIVAPYIGGGFGGKGSILSDAVLAALAARRVGRPVKVTLQRPLMFNNTTHRASTIQRIRLGATKAGRLTAIGHESWSGNLGDRPEASTAPTRLLYAGANRMTTLVVAHLDLPEASAMRAPGEMPGMMTLEIAMDELAEKLGMDPVALRVLNDTQVDPESPDKPFSQRQLVACLQRGAEQFGWNRRSARPATRREGRWLIGMGVASAIRGAGGEIGRTRAAGKERPAHGGNRHDRYRHRHLHHPGADGGRDAGRWTRPGGRKAGRFALSTRRRLRWPVWRGIIDSGRVRGLRQAARTGGRTPGVHRRRPGICQRTRARRRQQSSLA